MIGPNAWARLAAGGNSVRRIVGAGASSLLVAVLIATGPAGAATFTDEASWRMAAGGYAIETFDGFAMHASVTTLPGLGVELDPFGIGPPQADTGHLGGSLLRSQPNALYNSVDDMTSLGPFVIRPIHAGDRIFALGGWNVGTDDTLIFRFLDEGGGVIEEIETVAVGSGFAGIVSSQPAAVVTVSPGMGNGYVGMDDLQVVTGPAPVPALGSVGLAVLAGGVLGAGMRRLR